MPDSGALLRYNETMIEVREERVYWRETFFAQTFDFTSRMLFWRFDACIFVDCTLLIDTATEQLTFSGCTFRDCNLNYIDTDEARGLIATDNLFDRPLSERKADFDARLANALRARSKP